MIYFVGPHIGLPRTPAVEAGDEGANAREQKMRARLCCRSVGETATCGVWGRPADAGARTPHANGGGPKGPRPKPLEIKCA